MDYAGQELSALDTLIGTICQSPAPASRSLERSANGEAKSSFGT